MNLGIATTVTNDGEDEIDWDGLKKRYEAGREPVATLCASFRVSKGRLYRRIRREGWKRRSARQGGCRGQAGRKAHSKSTGRTNPRSIRKAGAGARGSNPPGRANLIARLYRALEHQVADAEARFLADDGSGFEEKDARVLGTLAQTLKKLIELEQTQRAETVDVRDEPDDRDSLREELARRIARLCRKG